MAILKDAGNLAIRDVLFVGLSLVTIVKMSNADQCLGKNLNINSVDWKLACLFDF